MSIPVIINIVDTNTSIGLPFTGVKSPRQVQPVYPLRHFTVNSRHCSVVKFNELQIDTLRRL